MSSPNLHVNFSVCSGCRACSIVCALSHENLLDLNHARIRVDKNFPGLERPVFRPRFCRNCKNARCVAVCPTGALTQQGNDGLVNLDVSLCNGCGHCVEACPFKAIWIDENQGIALKCDLCGGDPVCVKYCSLKALDFRNSKGE